MTSALDPDNREDIFIRSNLKRNAGAFGDAELGKHYGLLRDRIDVA